MLLAVRQLATRRATRYYIRVLSHAAIDHEIALSLKSHLQTALPGADIFVSSDPEDLPLGDPWVQTILSALNAANLVLALTTERGLSRKWVCSGVPCIPCCLGKVRKHALPAPFSSLIAMNLDEVDGSQLRPLALVVTILLPASLLIGCSNNLGRGEAQRAINKAVKRIPEPKELLINTGLVSGYCIDDAAYNPTDRPAYKALAKLGMVAIKNLGNGWQVEFTEAGKRAVKGEPYGHTQKLYCDEWQSSLPVAVFDGIEATGIQEEGIHAKADIAIKWKLTPLGLALRKLPEGDDAEMGLGREFSIMPKGKGEFSQNDVAKFEKYDDGWRLKTPE
jgi:hypothetical protein